MQENIIGICQSCGKHLERNDNGNNLGQNEDGSTNLDYCSSCLVLGRFSEPEVTLREMIDRCKNRIAEEQELSELDAFETAYNTVPNLKRWKFFN